MMAVTIVFAFPDDEVEENVEIAQQMDVGIRAAMDAAGEFLGIPSGLVAREMYIGTFLSKGVGKRES